eukprot:3462404-Amphidinium_carterae.1
MEEGELREHTSQISQTAKALESFFFQVHDLPPILSSSFAELNAKREEIETLLGNIVEKTREYHALVVDLERHRERIKREGKVVPLTRTVQQWSLVENMFEGHYYVCHHIDCHCNCHRSRVLAPFASLWCFMNQGEACSQCQHVYADHRILRSGWNSKEVVEHLDLGSNQDEATRVLESRMTQTANEKQNLVAVLEAALHEYSKLGLRDAFVRLLRSQRTLLEQQMQSRKDDESLAKMCDIVKKQLAVCEQAAEVNCCICYDNVADTVLSCGHR